MRRALVVVLIALAMPAVLPAAPAPAETTPSVKKNVVTITVKVDVFGAKGLTGPDGTTPLIDYWEQELEKTWGAAFKQFPYQNCFLFELDLDLVARDRDADDRKGRHRLHVTAARTGGGWDGVGWGGVPETSRDPATGDGTRSFENDRAGTLPANAPPTIIAHEFGHLFGLGDDRKDGTPKPGRDGTLMVGGAPGVDPNQPQRIDSKLIDRIGKAIREHLKDQGKKLPKCETWKGTISGGFQFPGCTPGTLSGDVTVGVVGDALAGTLRSTSSPHDCTGVAVGEFPIDANIVGGTKTRDRFELDFGGLYTAELEIDDGRASGVLVFSGPNPEFSFLGNAGSVQEITLECQNCGDEAVG